MSCDVWHKGVLSGLLVLKLSHREAGTEILNLFCAMKLLGILKPVDLLNVFKCVKHDA